MAGEEALRRAKRPRTILAGPYGHPVHAIAVTLPIGAWTASIIFDIVGFFSEEPEAFVRGALWLVGIGIVGALAAAVFGLMDLGTLNVGTRARRTAVTHMGINLGAVILFAAGFFVRLNAETGDASTAGFVLSLVAFALVGVSGFLGGEMVYRYGIRVADEATQVKAFE